MFTLFLFVHFVAAAEFVSELSAYFMQAFSAASTRRHPIEIRGSLERNTPNAGSVRVLQNGRGRR